MQKTTALGLFAASLLGLASTLGPCPEDGPQGSPAQVERSTFTLRSHEVGPELPPGAFADGPVAIEARLDRELLLAGGERELYLCLYVSGKDLVDAPPRLGVNLALVVDRSGSMASDGKLEHAIAAAEQLVARLGPDDDLALIAYDDQVQTLVPSRPVLERGVFQAALRRMVPGGSTNLYGGLSRGFYEVRSRKSGERLNRVLLLSDGLANVGELTTAWQLGTEAASMGRQGVRVSTMGMGVDYDADLMQQVASRSGGNYHYIAHPEDVGAFLTSELDELARTVAKDAVVTLRLADGVRVEEVYGHRFERGFVERADGSEGTAVRVPLEDLRAGERRRVLVRLRVEAAASSTASSEPVLKADLRYAVAATGEARATEGPWATVGYTRDHDAMWQSRDLAVWSKVEVVRNAETLLAAMELRGEGRWDDARGLLRERIDVSRHFNRTELGSEEVDRLISRLERVHGELETTAYSREAGLDLELREELGAMGYIGD